MSDTNTLISDYSDSIDEHRTWLKTFGEQRLQKWERLLRVNAEAAICEASTRMVLSEHGVVVEPYEDPSTGGPDFVCKKGGKIFFAEVTCIEREKVTSRTHLTDKPRGETYYALLTDVFLAELCRKVTQCCNLEAACLVVIGTLHRQGGAKCFGKSAVEDLLTGTTRITMKFDPEQGRSVGDAYQTTKLIDSAFIRFQKNSRGQVEFARNPISAVLLCGFGLIPPNGVGCLHPNPNYLFDRMLLPNIEFCRLVEGCIQTDHLKVEWI
jgi:hypothetical protein